jgi:penicillin-binding protein 1C
LGGSGRHWWFVDGQPVAQSLAGSSINQRFSRPGDYQLSVLDESGQTARLQFRVLD